ncbi:MAG: GNAT family N-acetyltransferase [Thermomicrobiales bacterium]|nr:GNAT family N-acetyltransferase [Thermomicrobiales bacterium]
MSDLRFRPATASDLTAIVAMLADDHLGAQRESPSDLTPYIRAFERMASNPDIQQIVATQDDEIVATMQLTFIPGLSHQGMTRLHIEGVRVRSDLRSAGIGSVLITWAIAYAREHECGMIELTTNKSREAAHRFYERLGFQQSHLGYKLKLT